jgi:HlyD family secretion protein
MDELTRERSLDVKGYSNAARIAMLETRVKSLVNNIALAQTQHRASLLRVKRQRRALEDYVVRAPFAGVVTEQAAQLGEIISPSTAGGGFTRTGLCTIVDMDSLEIVVDVNESFIDRIRKDQRVVGELYAYPGWQFEGRVIRIIPTADRAKATIKVRIKIARQDDKILPQMGVKVVFQSAHG